MRTPCRTGWRAVRSCWSTDVVRELLAVLGAVDDPADDIAVVPHYDHRASPFRRRPRHLAIGGGDWDHATRNPDGIDAGHPVARAMTARTTTTPGRNDVR